MHAYVPAIYSWRNQWVHVLTKAVVYENIFSMIENRGPRLNVIHKIKI